MMRFKTSRRAVGVLCTVLAVLLLAGCKKSKEAELPTTWSADEQARVAETRSAEVHFTTLQAKLNASISTSSKSLSSSGTIRIIAGERLQISITPLLGIEMLRAEFTADSVKMLDRINRRYVLESIKNYRESLPIDVRFETVQSLFTGELFVPGKTKFSDSDFASFAWRTDNDGTLVGRYNEDRYFVLSFFINTASRLAQTQVTNTVGSQVVEWGYSQYEAAGSGQFPTKQSLVYRIGSAKQLSADLTFSRIELDKQLNMTFEVPSSYKRIELADLISAYVK
jgi:hypothetical protein